MFCARKRMLASSDGRLPFSLSTCDHASSMRFLACLALLTLIAAGSFAEAAPLPPQQVDIPAPEGVLHAELYKPEGGGPFPTVIALHGCGGRGGNFEAGFARFC